MRILILKSYYYPERAASTYLDDNLIEDLVAAGHDVELYAPMPTRGVSNAVRRTYQSRRTEVLLDGHLRVHRFGMMREGRHPLQRALRYVLCCVKHYRCGMRAKGVDAVFLASTPPIQGLLGAWIGRRRGIPFIYNLQDIFPDSLVTAGLAKRGGLIWKIGRWIENYTYRHADRIIVISQGFRQNILAKGVPADKVDVVYNWVDEQAVVEVPRQRNPLFDTYRLPRDRFCVSYCGNIGLSQNMDLLLRVAKELPDVGFVLVGEGAYKAEVERIVRRDRLANVALLPFQPYEQISDVFSLADAGLIISKPGVGGSSVPSKTWSILSAGRPVIASFDDGELHDLVATHRCGLFAQSGDAEALKQAILTLRNDASLCRQMGRNGRKYILDHLTRRQGTARYIDIITSTRRQVPAGQSNPMQTKTS